MRDSRRINNPETVNAPPAKMTWIIVCLSFGNQRASAL
jgi:hypothetical protein